MLGAVKERCRRLISTDPGVWLASFFIIAIFSFAFRDNPAFKLSEHIFVAASVGNAVVMAVTNIQRYALTPISRGEVTYLLPCLLGLILYFQYHPKHYWISRYGMAFMMGVSLVIAFQTEIKTNFVSQIAMTIAPLNTLNAVVILIATITTLYYFVFTIPSLTKGRLGTIAMIGRYMIMIALGASFGNTVVTRMKLLIGQLLFLLVDWLGVMK